MIGVAMHIRSHRDPADKPSISGPFRRYGLPIAGMAAGAGALGTAVAMGPGQTAGPGHMALALGGYALYGASAMGTLGRYIKHHPSED